MNRTERLFALAEHLRARRTGVTAEELAARFGVTVRTIYRDLDGLRAAHLPLNAERGRGGGYALDRSYALPPVNFTAREAALLVTIGRWVTEMRLLPFAQTLDAAIDKVRGALPESGQRELKRLAEGLTFVGVPAHGARRDVARAIEAAFFDRVPLSIRYLGADLLETARTILVQSLVMERTVTLVNATDLDKGAVRQFRIDRILWARVVPAVVGTDAASTDR